MRRSWKQILFLTIGPKSKEDATIVSKISWFKITFWIAVVVLIGIFFIPTTTFQNYSLPENEYNFQDTVATTPADTTIALPAPTDNNIVAQDSSTVTPPADSNATVQPKLTLIEQQRQARQAKMAAKKAFFEKMYIAKKAKNDARAKFEAKNK